MHALSKYYTVISGFCKKFFPYIALFLWSGVLACLWFAFSRSKIADLIRPFVALYSFGLIIYILFSAKRAWCMVTAWFFGVAALLLSAVSGLAFVFFKAQRRRLLSDDIYAILQSDSHETFAYVSECILNTKSILVSACAVIVCGICLYVMYATSKNEPIPSQKRCLFGVVLAFVSVGIFFYTYPVKLLYKEHRNYFKDINEFNLLAEKIALEHFNFKIVYIHKIQTSLEHRLQKRDSRLFRLQQINRHDFWLLSL